VVGEAEHLVYAAMPLDGGCATPPSPTATRLETDDVGRVVPRASPADRPVSIPIPSPEERTDMKPANLSPARPEPIGEALAPLAEPEGLPPALAEALPGAARLAAALRHTKKEKRALANVWSSLKDLNLGA